MTHLSLHTDMLFLLQCMSHSVVIFTPFKIGSNHLALLISCPPGSTLYHTFQNQTRVVWLVLWSCWIPWVNVGFSFLSFLYVDLRGSGEVCLCSFTEMVWVIRPLMCLLWIYNNSIQLFSKYEGQLFTGGAVDEKQQEIRFIITH